MSIDSSIRTAITPLVAICVPDVYNPDSYEFPATEYCTFHYTEIPTGFGNNTATAIRYVVQLHWFLPSGINPYAKKKKIKKALSDAGFTYPSVTNASDGDGQHYVFETEWVDGDV